MARTVPSLHLSCLLTTKLIFVKSYFYLTHSLDEKLGVLPWERGGCAPVDGGDGGDLVFSLSLAPTAVDRIPTGGAKGVLPYHTHERSVTELHCSLALTLVVAS